MALRFLLVGLVASLGLDWSGGSELSGWARDGRNWVEARLVELTEVGSGIGRLILGSSPAEVAAESGPTTGDLAFDVVVEGMASNFADDLASAREEGTLPVLDSELLAEDGVTETPATLAWSDPEPTPAPTNEARPAPSRGDRLTDAVRLTRQAVGAWVSLIVEPSGDTADND